MLRTIIVLLPVGILLVMSEYLWRRKLIGGEYGRKLVHTTMGLYVASWPYLLPMHTIAYIACAAFATLVVSKKIQLFHAIHDVPRITYGEMLYPLGVLLVALLAQQPWIFTTSLLFISVADSAAAVFGKKYGVNSRYVYRVFGAKKSVVGTLAYVLAAYVCVTASLLYGDKSLLLANRLAVFVSIPLFTAFLEAVSPYGLDNITVPLAVVVIMNALVA